MKKRVIAFLSFVVLSSPAVATSYGPNFGADERAWLLAAETACFIGTVKRTTAGVFLGEFSVVNTVRDECGDDTIVLWYDDALVVNAAGDAPSIGDEYIVAATRVDSVTAAKTLERAIAHPLQLRQALASHSAILLVSTSRITSFLGTQVSSVDAYLREVFSFVVSPAEEQYRRAMVSELRYVCGADPSISFCAKLDDLQSRREVANALLFHLSSATKLSELTQHIERILVSYAGDVVGEGGLGQAAAFRSNAVYRKLEHDLTTDLPNCSRLRLGRMCREKYRSHIERAVVPQGEGINARWDSAEKTVVVFSLEFKVPVQASSLLDSTALSRKLDASSWILAGASALYVCGEHCVDACAAWARSARPAARFLGASCLMDTSGRANARKWLEVLSGRKDVVGSWAALTLARHGDKAAVDRLMPLLSRDNSSLSPDEAVLRWDLVALLINSFTASGIIVSPIDLEFDGTYKGLRPLWQEYRAKTQIADPWLPALQAHQLN